MDGPRVGMSLAEERSWRERLMARRKIRLRHLRRTRSRSPSRSSLPPSAPLRRPTRILRSSPSPLSESEVVGAPTSAPLPVGGATSASRSADGRSSSSRKAPSPVMTTVNTHNKIMNATYHPKLVRASVGGESPSVVDGSLGKSSSSSANFISTQTLAMQLPNGTLISPGESDSSLY